MEHEYPRSEDLFKEYLEEVVRHLFPNAPSSVTPWFNNGGTDSHLKKISIQLSNESILRLEPALKNKSTSLVHFTSLRTLYSILNEKCFRMYSFDNSNDPMEIIHSMEAAGIERGKIDLIKNYTYFLSMVDSQELTKDENILNLWRLYGHGGWGVAIEVEIKTERGIYGQMPFILGNVLYEKKDFNKFMEANKSFEKKHDRKVDIDIFLRVIAGFYKAIYYQIENEVRLIHNPERSELQGNSYLSDFNERTDIVSYYKLPIDNDEKDIGQPFVNIKKVEIGFQYSKEKFEEIKKHLQFGLNNGEINFEVLHCRLTNVHR